MSLPVRLFNIVITKTLWPTFLTKNLQFITAFPINSANKPPTSILSQVTFNARLLLSDCQICSRYLKPQPNYYNSKLSDGYLCLQFSSKVWSKCGMFSVLIKTRLLFCLYFSVARKKANIPNWSNYLTKHEKQPIALILLDLSKRLYVHPRFRYYYLHQEVL